MSEETIKRMTCDDCLEHIPKYNESYHKIAFNFCAAIQFYDLCQSCQEKLLKKLAERNDMNYKLEEVQEK